MRAVRALRPDVALLDIEMPILNGIGAARQICAESGTRVIMLTTFDSDALRAGASGLLLKDVRRDDLVHAVRVVVDGQALLSGLITQGSKGPSFQPPCCGASQADSSAVPRRGPDAREV